MAARVGGALGAVGLRYEGRARARHPLDVLVNDIGLDRIADAAVRPLAGLRVACYYGCLLVRPYAHIRRPARADVDGAAAGGGRRRAHRLAAADALLRRLLLLRRAARRRAPRSDTAAQPPAAAGRASGAAQTRSPRSARCASSTSRRSRARWRRTFGEPVDLTVGFFTQLLGTALGLDERALGIHRMLRWRLPEPAGDGGR